MRIISRRPPSGRRRAWLSLISIGMLSSHSAAADDHAVILLYHHISETTPASTSVAPATFERHLDYLAQESYTVMPLGELVEALVTNAALPARAVALTFDDGYVSVYEEALPQLERRNWPFTVFVATDYLDDGYTGFMSWDQLRDLERRGGTIANHSRDHAYLIRRDVGESQSAWRRRVRDNITASQARLDAELERPLPLFAYPYGEFDSALETIVAELGYVGLGQQSGPVGSLSDLRHLPRFPMATGFDSLESLAEKLRTRPLPVTVLAPRSRVLETGAPPPELRVKLPAGPYRREALTCYVAGQDAALIQWLGDVATIRARAPLGSGRSKYNCTAPSASETGIFYWYSHLWIVPPS